ncbi:hypothetical protein [Streptosporangium jomthongense]|uniref:Uncharacterized protein n=1 Tax=Streptosporangium jomthongense TaxID=1193683 RepID=A0ABV8FA84_9ACTN
MRRAKSEQTKPYSVALWLIRAFALDEADQHREGEYEDVAWGPYNDLTAVLHEWQDASALPQQSFLLVEWLAVELHAYLRIQYGDQVERYLIDFGDQVAQAQQHDHPAGPTAIAILSEAGADDAECRTRMARPYAAYLRDGHQVEDAREVVLTFALWAGATLAELMRYDDQRITSYVEARRDDWHVPEEEKS